MTTATIMQFKANEKKSQRVEFSNPYDMRMYVQSAIRDSKMKYSVLAKKAGVCSQTVSKIASGETKDPRTNTTIKLLFALGKRVYVE